MKLQYSLHRVKKEIRAIMKKTTIYLMTKHVRRDPNAERKKMETLH